MNIRYERGALADLEEIFAYIAADSRQAAGRVVARIERVRDRGRGKGNSEAAEWQGTATVRVGSHEYFRT